MCLLLYALYMVCRSSWQVADLCPLLYTVMADVAVDWTLVEWVSSAGWTWLGSAVLVGTALGSGCPAWGVCPGCLLVRLYLVSTLWFYWQVANLCPRVE